jgi:prepilin-type processing-associated H-X9-DG protein
MIKRTGFTKTDLIVTLACAAFVFVNAQIISAGGREKAKKEVCMANLRMLTAAWTIYAEDNAGKLVNGAPMTPGGFCSGCSESCAAVAPMDGGSFGTFHKNEIPWVGVAWNQYQWPDKPASVCGQKCAISTGALWKYVQDFDIYRCPDSNKNQLVTYTIMDSMNGKYTWNGNCGFGNTPIELCSKNLNQIIKPADRIVFIEEEPISPDSYCVFYACEKWFDIPCVQHGDGTTVSFADGHSEYWKWKAQETIDIAKGGIVGFQPVTSACKQDLYKLQIACWTKLGYTPTVAPDPNW